MKMVNLLLLHIDIGLEVTRSSNWFMALSATCNSPLYMDFYDLPSVLFLLFVN